MYFYIEFFNAHGAKLFTESKHNIKYTFKKNQYDDPFKKNETKHVFNINIKSLHSTYIH